MLQIFSLMLCKRLILFSEKVGSFAIKVSEKIEKELFDSILKLSKKVKKKKGRKGKVLNIF